MSWLRLRSNGSFPSQSSWRVLEPNDSFQIPAVGDSSGKIVHPSDGFAVMWMTLYMFGGHAKDPEWQRIKELIRVRFKWGQWESGRFLQCGVLIDQKDSAFLLSQPEYLDSINEIHVSRTRWSDLSAPVTPHELYQLRSVLGALSWHATQVGVPVGSSSWDVVV